MTFGDYGLTLHNVTSGQKAPLGRILRNFQLRMRTPKGTPKGSRDLWSLPVALVLVLPYYILYYYSKKKKTRETLHMRIAYFRDFRFRSGPLPTRVASGDVTSGHVRSGRSTWIHPKCGLAVPIYYLCPSIKGIHCYVQH